MVTTNLLLNSRANRFINTLIISDTFLKTVLYEYAYSLHKNERPQPIIWQVGEGFAAFSLLCRVWQSGHRERKEAERFSGQWLYDSQGGQLLFLM